MRNLQPLCLSCHKAKSSSDLRFRKLKPNTSSLEWQTHAQKDVVINELRADVNELQTAVRVLFALLADKKVKTTWRS